MNPIFPCLPDDTLAAVNTVGEWLAQDDVEREAAQNVDFVVLAGNAVIPTIDAACRFAAAQNVPLLISGGIGHSTSFLYAGIAHHPRYHVIATTGRAEASILADVARQFWQVPPENIRVDDQSTNCGENARFSWNMMKQQLPQAEHVLVVQDPTMQRRTMATFVRVCRDEPVSPQWVSHPDLSRSCKTAIRGWCSAGWRRRVACRTLFVAGAGELPRLFDDANGYGPAGATLSRVDFLMRYSGHGRFCATTPF
jgi:uncharacterized SAM-binding protein YcdF (DUF218 family)